MIWKEYMKRALNESSSYISKYSGKGFSQLLARKFRTISMSAKEIDDNILYSEEYEIEDVKEDLKKLKDHINDLEKILKKTKNRRA